MAAHVLDRRDTPGLGIGLSVAFHLALVGAAWWFSRDTGPKIDLDAKPIQAHLVKLGEKRDEKLLPRMQANAPPPPEAAPTPSPSSTPLQPSPPKPKTPPPPKQNIEKDLFAAFDQTKPPTKAEKQAGRADGDVNGDVEDATEGERYFGLMNSGIKRNYDVSSAISDAERVRLSATVIIYVDANGRVTKSDFQQKSGNDLFDSAVMAAVQKASPFPPPPPSLAKALATQGVALKFRP